LSADWDYDSVKKAGAGLSALKIDNTQKIHICNKHAFNIQNCNISILGLRCNIKELAFGMIVALLWPVQER